VVMPLLLTSLLVEAMHMFGASEFLAVKVVDFDVRIARVMANEARIAGHGRASVSTRHRHAPNDVRSALGKLFHQTIFAPDIVAVRPHPLRPAVCATRRRGEDKPEQRERWQSHGCILSNVSRQ